MIYEIALRKSGIGERAIASQQSRRGRPLHSFISIFATRSLEAPGAHDRGGSQRPLDSGLVSMRHLPRGASAVAQVSRPNKCLRRLFTSATEIACSSSSCIDDRESAPVNNGGDRTAWLGM